MSWSTVAGSLSEGPRLKRNYTLLIDDAYRRVARCVKVIPLTALGSRCIGLYWSGVRPRLEGVKLLKGKKLWATRSQSQPTPTSTSPQTYGSSGSRRNSVTEHLALPRTSRVDRPGRTWFRKVSLLYT